MLNKNKCASLWRKHGINMEAVQQFKSPRDFSHKSMSTPQKTFLRHTYCHLTLLV